MATEARYYKDFITRIAHEYVLVKRSFHTHSLAYLILSLNIGSSIQKLTDELIMTLL